MKTKLREVTFLFDVDGEEIRVNWLSLGREYIGRVQYPSVYRVYVHYKDGNSFHTSLAPNQTNSKDFLEKAIEQAKNYR